ncbi:hypothetical protein HPP92_022106 [Vanilla planifolia]|uniref:Uncharacterized protein n=1 Tax=Vanilla planifolia TaxID=51239 RepID=A0A835PP18_VANPL|nr:hypothetical protein HPP92_022106 [Vanilla planifolia]
MVNVEFFQRSDLPSQDSESASALPFSFPSEPPDIRNWFSSYKYDSQESEIFHDLEGERKVRFVDDLTKEDSIPSQSFPAFEFWLLFTNSFSAHFLSRIRIQPTPMAPNPNVTRIVSKGCATKSFSYSSSLFCWPLMNNSFHGLSGFGIFWFTPILEMNNTKCVTDKIGLSASSPSLLPSKWKRLQIA